MAKRAGSSLGYITSKALDGDWSPKEVSMETASFADRHDVALVIIELFSSGGWVASWSADYYISRYRSNFE